MAYLLGDIECNITLKPVEPLDDFFERCSDLMERHGYLTCHFIQLMKPLYVGSYPAPVIPSSSPTQTQSSVAYEFA